MSVMTVNCTEEDKTLHYVSQLNIKKIELKGSDYVNPIYNPERIGKYIKDIDIVYDYDFKQLRLITAELENIDREKVLKSLFYQISKGASTHKEKHLRILRFLQKVSMHNDFIQPMHEDRTMVMDPLILLKLNEMRCGHVARVAVDLFEAAGYQARVVQLGGHVIAEIFYESDWHYFDADVFGGGETVIDNKGNIPSIIDLSKTPFLIDSLSHYQELSYHGNLKQYRYYPSFLYFSKKAYKGNCLKYYVKNKKDKKMKLNKYYGWNDYITIEENKDNVLQNFNMFYQPGHITFKRIQQKSDQFTIKWEPSEDPDYDLIGYRIFVGTYSRGWHYNKFTGAPELKKYWQGGWKPEMYDALFKTPPQNAGFYETSNTSIIINIPSGEMRYVTVMPFDKHGESVGKRIYHRSEELVLRN
jgi:hypothetical protein